MALTGDFAKFGQLARNLGRLAAAPSQTAADAAPAIAALIEAEFAQGRDPYGREWAPLAPATRARGRKPPPLTDTGKMRAGVEVKPLPGAGIAITFADEVPARFHQRGTIHMPARKILPENVLPRAWNAALADAAIRAQRRAMGGK